MDGGGLLLLLGPHAAQDRGGVTREVGQDDVGAGSPQAHERLHHHLVLVDHAQGPAGFDHRVLAGDLHRRPAGIGLVANQQIIFREAHLI